MASFLVLFCKQKFLIFSLYIGLQDNQDCIPVLADISLGWCFVAVSGLFVFCDWCAGEQYCGIFMLTFTSSI